MKRADRRRQKKQARKKIAAEWQQKKRAERERAGDNSWGEIVGIGDEIIRVVIYHAKKLEDDHPLAEFRDWVLKTIPDARMFYETVRDPVIKIGGGHVSIYEFGEEADDEGFPDFDR